MAAAHTIMRLFSMVGWVSFLPVHLTYFGYPIQLHPQFGWGHGTLIVANVLYLVATVLVCSARAQKENQPKLPQYTRSDGTAMIASTGKSVATTL